MTGTTHTAAAASTTGTATGALLEVEDLHVAYRSGGRSVPAVSGVTFSLRRGERLAIIGESGAGKSTITQALLGILPPNAVLEARGRFESTAIFDGLDEHEWNDLRRTRISYVPQDPNIALDPVARIGAQLAEAIALGEPQVEKVAREKRAKELLGTVGLEDPERVHDAYPHQLSGGQRQRVLIAIALVGDPLLIVADEPTSGLDVAVQKLVLDLLDQIVRAFGVSVIMVTHDLAVASQRSDRILVLHDGRVVEDGPTDRVILTPGTTYTRRLVAAVPRARHTKLAPRPEVSSAAAPSDSAASAVRVDALEKTYLIRDRRRGRIHVRATRGVSFEIPYGSTFGLVGQSGSGKSTIARIVAGIEKPDAGDVTIGGKALWHGRRSTRRAVARDVQYVFQNPFGSLNPKQTIRQIIAEPLEGAGEPTRGTSAEHRIEHVLDAVGLPKGTASRRPTELSGGQRQRVAIARGIVTRPGLLVLDEPVSALDVTVQAQVLQLLVDLQQEFGTSYLFISHDLAVISQISDTVGVLSDGVLVEKGATGDLLDHPEDAYTRTLLGAIPVLTGAGSVSADGSRDAVPTSIPHERNPR